MTHIVLVSLGSLEPDEAEEWCEFAAPLGWHAASLKGAGPPLAQVVTGLAGPSERVRVVPVKLGSAPVGVSWVRRVLGDVVRQANLSGIEVATAVSTVSAVAVAAALQGQDRPVTGIEAPLTDPDWEEPPPHRCHVLVCRGPRCNARGAAEAQTDLMSALRRRSVLDNGVLVTTTGCLFPCNRAPVAVVYPQGRWVTLSAGAVAASLASELS